MQTLPCTAALRVSRLPSGSQHTSIDSWQPVSRCHRRPAYDLFRSVCGAESVRRSMQCSREGKCFPSANRVRLLRDVESSLEHYWFLLWEYIFRRSQHCTQTAHHSRWTLTGACCIRSYAQLPGIFPRVLHHRYLLDDCKQIKPVFQSACIRQAGQTLSR